MTRAIAVFLVGALVGSALMLALLSSRIDNLYIMNKQLLLEQAEHKEKVQILQDRLAQYHKLIVVGFDFKYDSAPESLERLSLERDMKQVLRSLIGQAVRELKPDTVMALLDKRIMAVGDKSYRVNVRAVVLAERVSFYLRVTLHRDDSEDDEP